MAIDWNAFNRALQNLFSQSSNAWNVAKNAASEGGGGYVRSRSDVAPTGQQEQSTQIESNVPMTALDRPLEIASYQGNDKEESKNGQSLFDAYASTITTPEQMAQEQYLSDKDSEDAKRLNYAYHGAMTSPEYNTMLTNQAFADGQIPEDNDLHKETNAIFGNPSYDESYLADPWADAFGDWSNIEGKMETMVDNSNPIANAMRKYESVKSGESAADGDDVYAAWKEYFAKPNGLGSKYTGGLTDFQMNGTNAEWAEALQDPLLKSFYQELADEYGFYDENGEFNQEGFDNYFNTYKNGATFDDLISAENRGELLRRYLGTSSGVQDSFANYLLSIPNEEGGKVVDGLFEQALAAAGYLGQTPYGGYDYDTIDPEAGMNVGREKMKELLNYQMGDLILQDMVNKGFTADEFLNEYTMDEINQIFSMDPSVYYLDGPGETLNEWGKTEYPTHEVDFNPDTYRDYGSPYGGLPDTLAKLAGDRIKHGGKDGR